MTIPKRYEIDIDRTFGLIHHDTAGTWVLTPKVQRWCEDVLGGIPEVIVELTHPDKQREPQPDDLVKTRLAFEFETDEILFRVSFAQHWWPHLKTLPLETP